MSESTIIMFFAIIAVATFGLILYMAYTRDQLKRYVNIEIGMSETDMLNIMGGGYNKSSLKNNRFKYEWRINASSYSNGFGGRKYSGVKKVDIYVKDGLVEEIRPYNV